MSADGFPPEASFGDMSDNLEQPMNEEPEYGNLRQAQPVAGVDGCIQASMAPAIKSQSLGAKLLVSPHARFAVLLHCCRLSVLRVGAACAAIDVRTLHRALRCAAWMLSVSQG
jgi:hypothetical protein